MGHDIWNQAIPATVFAHLLPGEIRVTIFPDQGMGCGEWDVPIDRVPPELPLPNTKIWIEASRVTDRPFIVIERVWKREA